MFYKGYLSFIREKKTLYEKYAGGTKMKIHGTKVKYQVQNTHGTKWFWYDMTIIPEDIRKHMISREKHNRQEPKILWQRNIEFLSNFHLLFERGFMKNIMTAKYIYTNRSQLKDQLSISDCASDEIKAMRDLERF